MPCKSSNEVKTGAKPLLDMLMYTTYIPKKFGGNRPKKKKNTHTLPLTQIPTQKTHLYRETIPHFANKTRIDAQQSAGRQWV